MRKTVYMEHMDAFTYRDLVARGAVAFVPVGALEQHGPHMSITVDSMLAKRVAGEVAQCVGGVVTAPISFGYKSQQRSGGGSHLSGTISLDGSTLIAIVRDVTRGLAQDGLRSIVFVNGHYENTQFIYEGVDLALRDLHAEGIDGIKVLSMAYWDFVDDRTVERLYPDGFTGWSLEHAGVLETSLMLLWYPEDVDMDRIDPELFVGLPAVVPNYDCLPVVHEYTPPSGCMSHPGASSIEKGTILSNVIVSNMTDAVKREFKLA